MKCRPTRKGKSHGDGTETDTDDRSVTNLPTEQDMIALARLTIFGNDRRWKDGKEENKDEGKVIQEPKSKPRHETH